MNDERQVARISGGLQEGFRLAQNVLFFEQGFLKVETMNMKAVPGWLAFFVGVLSASGASASVAVLPVERANLTPSEGEAIGAVVAEAYAEASRDQVVMVVPAARADGTPGTYAEAASLSRSSEYLVVRATRLNERIVVTAIRYSLDGKEIFHTRMVAASLDDMEPVAARLSTALFQKKDPSETRTINTVTEREGKKVNRTFVEKVIGIKTSHTLPVALGSSTNYEPMIAFGANGRLEGEKYFLEVGAGFTLPGGSGVSAGNGFDSAGGIYGELGGSYYLNDKNVSPYVGGGISPRILGGRHVDVAPNLAVFGQAGLMFFRTSSSRLYADLRISQNLTPWSNTPDYVYSYDPVTRTQLEPTQPAKTTTYPTEFGLAVGVGW